MVLTTDGHEGGVYELSGDEAWTYADLAAAFGDALGREVVYCPVTPDEHREVPLGAGLDDGTAGFVVAIDKDVADGLLAIRTGERSKLIGRPRTPMRKPIASWASLKHQSTGPEPGSQPAAASSRTAGAGARFSASRASLESCFGEFSRLVSASQPLGRESRTTLCHAE